MSIARVQVKAAGGAASANSVTFDNPTVTGNCIIVIACSYGGDGADGCTDNKGNTYTEVTTATGGALSRVRIWYCANAVGGSGHQVTPTATASYRSIVALEYSGVAAVSPLEDDSQNSGSSTRATTGNLIVGVDGSLILAAVTHEGGAISITEDAGNVLYEVESAAVIYPASFVELTDQSPESINPGWDLGGSVPWTANAAVFSPIVDPVLAPSNLTVVAAGSGSANVGWDDNSDNEDGFQLQVDSDSEFSNPQTIDIDSADTTTTTAINLEPGRTYYFRVRAYNGGGNSDWSGTATLVMPRGGSASAAKLIALGIL